MTGERAPGPVVLDVAGTRVSPEDAERLLHPNAGMVILFARNFASPGQLAELVGAIHALREPRLLVAVDQEGGRVQRFREGFTRVPPMAALGRLWEADPLEATRAAIATGYVIGAELRAHGVDFTFAPVLDLDWGRCAAIGDRALHADPRAVTILAGHLQHGLALAGMASCGKHFPGHGWAGTDSHTAVARDPRGLKRILAEDAAPYRWLGPALQAVMPAHVIYPRVDSVPAGFSRRWIQDILRGELGFAGAVFSDDLSMHAARVAGDLLASAHAALAAGCDFVLACNDAQGAGRLLEGLRWQPGEHFAARRRMLEPRGEAPSMAGLAALPQYRQAAAIVRGLAARA
jgi:beta-N-acetylhexosaminidase